jgi:D-alanyl-D-alanine carboxypeptidase (penicillin-binding protein 5/6)
MSHLARRLISAFGLSLALLTGAAPSLAQAEVLRVNTSEPRYAAIVVDANSGEVLYSKRADNPRYPASITKVMTMYLAFEALAEGRLKPTDRIVVSPRAAAQSPTKLGLRAGETISVDDAMRAIAVKSANDMAVALAEKIGGTESRFAELMTLRARELGMTNTRFVNASGLPDTRQVTSARDLAILSRAVMRDYPQYYSYFSQRQFTYRGQTMRNHNHLLGQMPGVDGIKTGFTNASGFNLAASAVRDGHRLIAVVLGGSSGAWRDDNVEDLLLTGFNVIKRRGMGEKITVAQNMFEPQSAGAYKILRAPAEQGDAEQDGMTIQLTNNPAAGTKYAVLDTMKPIANPPTRTVAVVKAAKETGEYVVQVGAFKERTQAQTHLKAMSKRFGSILSEGEGEVTGKVDGFYRVRYVGFSQDDARDACKALRAKAQSCLVSHN